ncbi:MAG TPA: GxxExxY protein [Candidatus Saccharimonadales bacterium]|nr:GxxExxY protein [Candidatus Saccharimonadales bacterium]
MSADLLYEELTYKVRGAIFKVYNTLGFGHKEGIYCKALALELKKEEINFKQEQSIDVLYDKQKIGVYRPDFVIDNKILLEIKALPFMGKDPETQMTYYLKGTNFKIGLLINFGSNKLDIRRRIWSKSA